jgi:hypothetical protein
MPNPCHVSGIRIKMAKNVQACLLHIFRTRTCTHHLYINLLDYDIFSAAFAVYATILEFSRYHSEQRSFGNAPDLYVNLLLKRLD